MLRGDRLAWAKGLLAAWSAQFYRAREDLVVLAFGGDRAELIRPAAKAGLDMHWLVAAGGGGGTPLAAAVTAADSLLAQARRRSPRRAIHISVLTDGRIADVPPRPRHADHCSVIDFESAAVPLARAARLAEAWSADYAHVDGLVDAPLR